MVLLESISAITSWEDYEYQGHMALYIALKNIYNLMVKFGNVDGYDLQIEGEEDFSIRKNTQYITLHQVKAGAIRLKPNDKFAFIIGILQNKAQYGYFHIANGKNLQSDFVSSTLSHINELERELNKDVKEKKDILNPDEEKNYIIVDKISGNHEKGSAYSIIKCVSENSKDSKKIKSIISDIKDELNRYRTEIENRIESAKKEKPSLSADKVFLDMFGEKYDNVKQIRQKAYEIIVEILKITCPEYIFADVDYAALVYDQLLLYMKNRITDFYIKKNKNGKCILTFDEIINQVVVDYHKKIDTVFYQYFQVLKSIRDAYAEYPNEAWNNCNEINCKDCNSSAVCNLFKQINILNDKSNEDKNRIIHNLILKTPTVGKNNNLPQDSLISHLFLHLLDEIKAMGLRKNNAYEAIIDKNKVYRLTLDSSYDIYEFQKKLRKELENEIDKTLLYECDVLITDRLCEENLLFNGGDVNILTEKELNEISEMTSFTVENMKKDCNRPKVIRLVDKNRALGELK